MNRRERRATGAHKKTAKLDPIIAIHEAGHAIARILAADQLGLPPAEVISYIEVGSGKITGNSAVDPNVIFKVQATVYGPMFSNELMALFRKMVAGGQPGNDISALLKAARAEGAGVDGWLRGRMLWTVFGSAAEAMYTGKPISEVWNSPESEGDFQAAVEDGIRAGLSTEQIRQFIAEAIARAEDYLTQPNVRRAVYALADALPPVGRMSGKKAYKIIKTALAEEK